MSQSKEKNQRYSPLRLYIAGLVGVAATVGAVFGVVESGSGTHKPAAAVAPKGTPDCTPISTALGLPNLPENVLSEVAASLGVDLTILEEKGYQLDVYCNPGVLGAEKFPRVEIEGSTSPRCVEIGVNGIPQKDVIYHNLAAACLASTPASAMATF